MTLPGTLRVLTIPDAVAGVAAPTVPKDPKTLCQRSWTWWHKNRDMVRQGQIFPDLPGAQCHGFAAASCDLWPLPRQDRLDAGTVAENGYHSADHGTLLSDYNYNGLTC